METDILYTSAILLFSMMQQADPAGRCCKYSNLWPKTISINDFVYNTGQKFFLFVFVFFKSCSPKLHVQYLIKNIVKTEMGWRTAICIESLYYKHKFIWISMYFIFLTLKF